jgi:putative ATP-dependent endonuclease of the OLD family
MEPYTARLTYLFRPTSSVTDDGTAAQPAELTVDNYDFIVFGGDDEDYDAQRVRRFVSLAVLPALRDAVNDLGNVQRSPLTELIEHLPPEMTKVRAIAAEIDQATNVLTEDLNLQLLEERIDEQIRKLAGPQLDVEPTLGLNPSRPEQLIRSLRLFVGRERTRSVSDTSTGNANVIYLALLLERLTARREAGRNVATLLGVEEPEAHLHPGLQRQLFSYLLRHGPNLLLTTHSPNITAVSPLKSIVLLHGDAEHGTTASTAMSAGLDDAEVQDLERYLDVTRAEALFARFVLLVEGIAELYLLPAIARVFDFDLDAWGVVVTSVGGTDFKPYRKMLATSGFRIPHAIATDGDRDKGKYGYLGLTRTYGLLDPDAQGEFRREFLELIKKADSEQEQRLLTTGWAASIFVGWDTLELDVAPLIGDQLKEAFADLSKDASSTAAFNEAVDRAAVTEATPDDKKTIITKIENFGKGRFAQRLASKVESLDPAEFLAHCATTYPAAAGASGPSQCLHLLAALNSASLFVRGVGIFG